MQVKEFQRKIAEYCKKWDKKYKQKPVEQSIFIHLVEKIGELARQYVNLEKRKEKFSNEDLENAIGDILLQTIILANIRNIDIEKLIVGVIHNEAWRVKE